MKNDEAIKVFEDYLTTGHVPHPYELREASKAAITVLSSYEQMIKDAVDGYVTLTLTGALTVAATIKEKDNVGIGDKVRIIIVKEEG